MILNSDIDNSDINVVPRGNHEIGWEALNLLCGYTELAAVIDGSTADYINCNIITRAGQRTTLWKQFQKPQAGTFPGE